MVCSLMEIALWRLICFLIGSDGGDDMADPSEKTSRTDPEAGGDDQPKNSPPEMAVIELSYSWYQETQYSGITGTCHCVKAFSVSIQGIALQTFCKIASTVDYLSELLISIKFFE
jgi:hypothetical protein